MGRMTNGGSWDRSWRRPLLWQGFGWSFLLHLVLLFAIEALYQSGALGGGPRRDLSASLSPQPETNAIDEISVRIESKKVPTIFVDANPDQATKEKPDETDYYSVVDAVAGDSSPVDDKAQPELDGRQDKVMKTEDTLPAEVMTLAPAVAPAPKTDETEPEPEVNDPTELDTQPPQEDLVDQPEPTEPDGASEAPQKPLMVDTEKEPEPKGDLPVARSVPELRPLASSTPEPARGRPAGHKRPRTLAEARSQKGVLIGEKMKQEGGAPEFRLQSTPDLLATPFGTYDAAVIQAIQQRWFGLLANLPAARSAAGKVVLGFQMKSDGSILGMKVIEDTVGVIQSLVCQRAVQDPAPYGRWPNDMRRLIGRDYREIRFTFYYN